jgi:hypothetical protein
MKHREAVELGIGAGTLLLSLYVAFGPLRHRLPRVLTRFAKYSAAAKLTSLSLLSWFWFYRNAQHDGPRALGWALSLLGVSLLAAAYYVIRRPVIATPTAQTAPIVPAAAANDPPFKVVTTPRVQACSSGTAAT